MSAFSHLTLSVTAIVIATSIPARAGDRYYNHRHERVEPLSVNILDPHRTRVTRTPSGSVVIEDRYHAYHASRYYDRRHHYGRYMSRPVTPYAPPAFHIIGDVSPNSAAKPVALNHGIQPRRGFQTQPKVVFLVMKPGDKTLSVRR
jgi:hypothetical protein